MSNMSMGSILSLMGKRLEQSEFVKNENKKAEEEERRKKAEKEKLKREKKAAKKAEAQKKKEANKEEKHKQIQLRADQKKQAHKNKVPKNILVLENPKSSIFILRKAYAAIKSLLEHRPSRQSFIDCVMNYDIKSLISYPFVSKEEVQIQKKIRIIYETMNNNIVPLNHSSNNDDTSSNTAPLVNASNNSKKVVDGFSRPTKKRGKNRKKSLKTIFDNLADDWESKNPYVSQDGIVSISDVVTKDIKKNITNFAEFCISIALKRNESDIDVQFVSDRLNVPLDTVRSFELGEISVSPEFICKYMYVSHIGIKIDKTYDSMTFQCNGSELILCKKGKEVKRFPFEGIENVLQVCIKEKSEISFFTTGKYLCINHLARVSNYTDNSKILDIDKPSSSAPQTDEQQSKSDTHIKSVIADIPDPVPAQAIERKKPESVVKADNVEKQEVITPAPVSFHDVCIAKFKGLCDHYRRCVPYSSGHLKDASLSCVEKGEAYITLFAKLLSCANAVIVTDNHHLYSARGCTIAFDGSVLFDNMPVPKLDKLITHLEENCSSFKFYYSDADSSNDSTESVSDTPKKVSESSSGERMEKTETVDHRNPAISVAHRPYISWHGNSSGDGVMYRNGQNQGCMGSSGGNRQNNGYFPREHEPDDIRNNTSRGYDYSNSDREDYRSSDDYMD